VKELLLTEAQLKDLRDFFRIWPDGTIASTCAKAKRSA